jgi:hypothetical protein
MNPKRAASLAFGASLSCTAPGRASATALRGLSSSSDSSATSHPPTRAQHEASPSESDFAAVNNHMADIWEPYSNIGDIPILWAPSTGSASSPSYIESYMSDCIGLDLASGKAKGGPLLEEDADVLIHEDLHQIASKILTSRHQGRIFTLMQHPVDRIIGLLDQESNPETPFVDNLMTRQLVGKLDSSQELSKEDLEDANAVLSRKVLVGLWIDEHKHESMTRFSTYFGWQNSSCTESSESRQHKQQSNLEIGRDSETWNEIVEANQWDVSLYNFAVQLFDKQALLFATGDTTTSLI